MSNWDDEDYDADLASSNLKASWDDEEEDAAFDSWENALDDDDEKKAPARKHVPLKEKIKEREEKERLEREAKALALREENEAEKKERLKKLEQENDMANVADLMGDIDIHPRAKQTAKVTAAATQAAAGPSKLSDLKIFNPTNKQEFEDLRKTITPILKDLQKVSSIHYPNLVTDLSRDLTKTLNQDQIRKVISTLNAVLSEKQRADRANRGKKPKAQLKGLSSKVDESKDTTNYDDIPDDFGDDDFM